MYRISSNFHYISLQISGMALFLKNISFHGILLDALFEEGNSDWEAVSELLTQGIQSGAVKPLQTSVFDRDHVEAAFRFMAQGKHIGKVLVKVCIQKLYLYKSDVCIK